MIARMVAVIRHQLCIVQLDGFIAAGNHDRAAEYAAKAALLEAELRPLTSPAREPRDDDDDDGKIAAAARITRHPAQAHDAYARITTTDWLQWCGRFPTEEQT